MYTVQAILAVIAQFLDDLGKGLAVEVEGFLKEWVRKKKIRPAQDFIDETRPLLETVLLLKRFPKALGGKDELEKIQARARLHSPWVIETRRALYGPTPATRFPAATSAPVPWAATFENVDTGMTDNEILKATGRPVKHQGKRKRKGGARQR